MGRVYFYPHLPYKSTIHGGKYNNCPMDPNPTIWGNAIHHTSQLRWRCTAAGSSHGNGGEVEKWEWAPNKAAVGFYFLKATCFGNDLDIILYKHILQTLVLEPKNIFVLRHQFFCKCCKSHRNKVSEFNSGLAWNPWILRMELDLRIAGVTLMVPWRWRSRKFLVRRFVDMLWKLFLFSKSSKLWYWEIRC